jgi:hypothetical protein
LIGQGRELKADGPRIVGLWLSAGQKIMKIRQRFNRVSQKRKDCFTAWVQSAGVFRKRAFTAIDTSSAFVSDFF